MEHRVQLCPGALIEEGDKGPPRQNGGFFFLLAHSCQEGFFTLWANSAVDTNLTPIYKLVSLTPRHTQSGHKQRRGYTVLQVDSHSRQTGAASTGLALYAAAQQRVLAPARVWRA